MIKELNARPHEVRVGRSALSLLSTINLTVLLSLLFTAATVAAKTTPARVPSPAPERRAVNAKTVYVRDSQMRIVCTLRRGEHFDIFRSAQGGYVFGFAYGQCRKEGYVKRDYLE